jgi:hypothetical protein
MTHNLANWDRLARFVLGALLIVLAITGTIGVWGYIGTIFVGTAFVSFCPVYLIMGLSTCKKC